MVADHDIVGAWGHHSISINEPAIPPQGIAPVAADGRHAATAHAEVDYFLNSTFPNMPRQRAAMKGPTLQMSCADAQQRGLVDEQEVDIANERAVLRARLRVSDEIRPGVVALPGKWWSDSPDAVVNLLTSSLWSPRGQPAYNDTSRIEELRS